MKFLSVKNQIALGLVFLMFSAMLMVSLAGFAPDEREAIVDGRGNLCESIAINSSYLLADNAFHRMESLLVALVERNDDVLSAGLRKAKGDLLAEVGEHDVNWPKDLEYSTADTVQVPLYRKGKVWGNLEIRFVPLQQAGMLGVLFNRQFQYFALVVITTFVSFSLYLGKVLQQLDPSKAVPKRVRTALDTLAEGLIVTDRRNRVILANEAFAKWVGKEADKMIGKSAEQYSWSFTEEAVGDGERFPWVAALKNEKAEAGRLIRLTDHNGRVLTLVANSSPILGAEGQYRGVLTSFEDVTDLERHKVELSKARDRADEANQAKSEFLARMSHEIRTPMNAILGYTEVLRFGIDDTPTKRDQHLSTIQSSGEHLLALINDILDLSKIESGQMELEQQPISVHETISHVVSVLGIKAKEKGICLEYVVKDCLPEQIYGDGVRLKQTIINLVGNAIKFTENGGVLIQTSMVEDTDGVKLAIQIADSGIGMSQEAMDNIFEPFAQADTSITRRFGGTGLGLAICKELTEKMGGSISVQSEVGQGSVFTVMIDPGDLSGVKLLTWDELQSNRTIATKTSRQFQMPDANILIVDDGPENRELVALFLQRAGAQFEMAENGQIAVEKVQAGNFDAVLMDMHMPVLDGMDATRTMRELGFDLPIIAVTADAMAEDEKRCREAGCSGFLPKPIKCDRLFETLLEAIPDKVIVQLREESQASALENERQNEQSVAEGSMSPDHAITHEAPTTQTLADDTLDQAIESNLPMDDKDFVYIAGLFHQQLIEKLKQMEAACDSRDAAELRDLGHWLKGSGGSAGFNQFNKPGKQLETFALAEDFENAKQHIAMIARMESRIRIVPIEAAV